MNSGGKEIKMVGITSYGAYIPYYRLNRFEIMGAWMGQVIPQPGEKAVANWDEDSVTMAVAAGQDCLTGIDNNKIDGVYMATTSSPYKERQAAGIVSAVLDCRRDIRVADFTDSIRASTIALNSAFDAIKGGTAKNMLVAAGECRLGATASASEMGFGDAAAALMLGDEGVIASLEGTYTISEDFMDMWRSDRDNVVRQWEDRWMRDEGYGKVIPEAVAGLLAKCNLSIGDVTKVAFFGPYAGEHVRIGKAMKAQPAQVQAHLLDTVGNTGAAHAMLMLVAALEDSKPGDTILVASYGNGSDAMLFKVTDEIEKVRNRKGVKGHLAIKAPTSYTKYLRWREMVPLEPGGRAEAELRVVSTSALWRHRKETLALYGSKCTNCGTPQYPPQRVCYKCGTYDQIEDYKFADKKAKVFTFTQDVLAFTIDPPAIYAVVDFEGGGRGMFD
ncbi:MAG: zinc ribbon domain-containing protein, partial [Chloroflexota bacterium]|nr:zinc ribbon domain-containing protein [Chloroflexota bacterium]